MLRIALVGKCLVDSAGALVFLGVDVAPEALHLPGTLLFLFFYFDRAHVHGDDVGTDAEGFVDCHTALYSGSLCHVIQRDQRVPLLDDDRLGRIYHVLLHLNLCVVAVHVDQDDVPLIYSIYFNLAR